MLRTILAISKIEGIGDAFFMKHIDALMQGVDYALETLKQSDNRITDVNIEENIGYADAIIGQCAELGIHIIPIWDNIYPSKLREMSDAPVVLYALGNIDLLRNKSIAIIGTRKSSPLGEQIARKVGNYFAHNYSICNGLVAGIDKASILIDENDAHSMVIGVLSGGLNYTKCISAVSRHLAELVIKKDGLLISPFEPNFKEDSFSGSKASKIQAGLSSALILIESSIDGGSKYTIKSFAKLNRVIGVINYPSNEFYQTSESFSANRLIAESKLDGILQICNLKRQKSISIKDLVIIENQNGYRRIEDLLLDQKHTNSSLFD